MKYLLLGMALLAGAAQAHGDAPHAGPVLHEQKPWGIAGDVHDPRRSVTVTMGDDMRFRPDHLVVHEGQTVRLVLRNRGRMLHEFVLGTPQELDEHAALMARFPDMKHDEPYMAHVAPGRRGEIVWLFNRAGEFRFACLIAGHYQAGMVGQVVVASAAVKRSR